MSWRQSSGRDRCNRCRIVVQLGAPVYVGELTPAAWCEADAGEVLGQFTDGKDVPVHVAPMTGLDPEASETLRGLRERFALRVRPTWGEERE